MLRHGRLAVLLTIAVAALAAPAQGAVTFGSDLTRQPLNGYGCWLGGTFAQTDFSLRSAAAPQDGVVVRWRMRAGSGGEAPLRVVRKLADGTYFGVATSAPGVIDTEGYDWADRTRTYPTRLPIRRGDFLGIDVPVGGKIVTAFGRLDAQVMWTGVPGSELRSWDPRLGDGEARAPGQAVNCFDGGSGADLELLVNADIEDDADRDGYGDETQDRCPADAQRQEPPCGVTATAPTPDAQPQPAPGGSASGPPDTSASDSGGVAGARAGAAPGQRAANVRIRHVRIRSGRLHVAGSIARGCRGSLTLRSARSVRIHIRASQARWTASLRAPRGQRIRLAVVYRGNCATQRLRLTASR